MEVIEKTIHVIIIICAILGQRRDYFLPLVAVLLNTCYLLSTASFWHKATIMGHPVRIKFTTNDLADHHYTIMVYPQLFSKLSFIWHKAISIGDPDKIRFTTW